jgi:hypothetical protein
MLEYLQLLWFFIIHPEAFIFALSVSGPFGFWIVQQLVRIYEWVDKMMGPIFGLPYNDFWVIALIIIGIILCIVFGIPIWWISVSLSKIAKMFTIYVASRFRATSIKNERAK